MALPAELSVEPPGVGYVGRIPVRNLWLLMLYAADLFRTRGNGMVGVEDNPDDLPDLVARHPDPRRGAKAKTPT